MEKNDGKGEILFLNPVFKQMIWGGNRLGTEWGYPVPGENTGECWAVSAHPNGDDTIREGRFAGKHLSELWEKEHTLFGNAKGDRFPLLIKIIDAAADLSIQVHPNDAYAAKNENGSLGKKECWYILDAPEGAELVVGHNARTKEELQSMITEGRWSEFLRLVPVKKGDFIQIDPGTVHAIKGGIEILETQQNSDITYRVYDYDRLSNGKPRELHIQKSLDVITVPAKSAAESVIRAEEIDAQPGAVKNLYQCDEYQVWKVEIDGSLDLNQEKDFLIGSVISGEGNLNGTKLKKGDHFILPADFGEMHFEGKMTLIASSSSDSWS